MLGFGNWAGHVEKMGFEKLAKRADARNPETRKTAIAMGGLRERHEENGRGMKNDIKM